MLEILLSSGSFDEECQNLKKFLLSPTLPDKLEQLGFKKHIDDTKLYVLTTWQKFMQHLPKVKADYQTIKNNLKTV